MCCIPSRAARAMRRALSKLDSRNGRGVKWRRCSPAAARATKKVDLVRACLRLGADRLFGAYN